MREFEVTLTGVTGLLMHADRLCNALDPLTKAHKELTSTRKKTDETHEAIARSEFLASLYIDKDGPYMPTQNVASALVSGGKFNKLGASFKRSIILMSDKARLKYDGPRTAEELWNDKRFVDCRSVVVNRNRLPRYRPFFADWSCTLSLMWDEEILDAASVHNAMELAGKMIGVGDYRPECGGPFGRFVAKWK